MSELSAKITISAIDHASAVVKGIGNTLERLKAQSAGLSAAWGNVSNAAGNVARNLAVVGIAAAGVGASVYAMTKHYADVSEQLQLSANKAGVSTDALQRLQYSAKLANIEASKLDTGLKFLNKNMAASLVTGSKGKENAQAKAFKELGINVHNTNGTMKTADQTILEVADSFHNKMLPAAEKVRIAQALLGRAGTDLVPILNQGSEALKKQGDELARLGHILTSKEIESNKHFAEDLKKLNFAVSGLGAVVASALIPVLTPLVEQMTEWIAANKAWLGTEIKDDVIAFGTALKSVWIVLKALKEIIWPVVAAFGGLKTVILSIGAIYLTKTILSLIQLGRAVYGLVPAFLALDAAISPILGIVAAVALIGYALYELIAHFDEFKAAWLSLWSQVPQPVKEVIRIVAAIMTLGMSEIAIALYDNWGKIGNVFKTGIQGALSGVESLFKSFVTSVVNFFSPLIGILNLVVEGVTKIKNAIMGGVSGTVNIKTNVGNVPTGSYGIKDIQAPNLAPSSLKTSMNDASANGIFQDSSRYSMMSPPKQKLDVYMKIDADGRPQQVTAKADSNTTFHASTGAMV